MDLFRTLVKLISWTEIVHSLNQTSKTRGYQICNRNSPYVYFYDIVPTSAMQREYLNKAVCLLNKRTFFSSQLLCFLKTEVNIFSLYNSTCVFKKQREKKSVLSFLISFLWYPRTIYVYSIPGCVKSIIKKLQSANGVWIIHFKRIDSFFAILKTILLFSNSNRIMSKSKTKKISDLTLRSKLCTNESVTLIQNGELVRTFFPESQRWLHHRYGTVSTCLARSHKSHK